MNFLSLIIINLIRLICFPLNFFFNKNIEHNIYQLLRQKKKKIIINNKPVLFFVPNKTLDWRINTFFTKEPDTLEWIKNFKKKKNSIFWDIGANIGIYSIYARIIHKKLSIFAFEPSFLNLYFLSKNFFINNFRNEIKIVQTPLSQKKNNFFNFIEGTENEGGAFNSLTVNKYMKMTKNSYNIISTTIEELINSNALKIPNYVKIDVDGNEYEILKGFGKHLKNKNFKEILIEIDEDQKLEKLKVLKILNRNGFRYYKKVSTKFEAISDENTYNYFFRKK